MISIGLIKAQVALWDNKEMISALLIVIYNAPYITKYGKTYDMNLSSTDDFLRVQWI